MTEKYKLMTEKYKGKDVKQSLLRACRALRFSVIFLGLVLIVQLATPQNLLAQETTKNKITGTIIASSDNMPVPGASIKIKGTSLGTVTDVDGNFSLNVSDKDNLIITCIGFVTKEIEVAGKSSIQIKLDNEVSKLDEIVVIGYGTSRRKDITGAISSVSGDELRKTNPVTFDQAMQGKVPGVVIQQISGQPGGGAAIQIRGISSLNGSSVPMYVIDGVIIGGQATAGAYNNNINPLAGIDPSEIESIDVLKDASATAIYGSQATNGVIIITTKRGKSGAPTISYEFSTGIQQVAKKLPVMNLQDYATFLTERNAGLGWGFDSRPNLVNPKYLGKGTDWQSVLFRNAPMTNHSITVSGGDTRTQYLFSGSYSSQQGIAIGSDFKRASLRVNIDNKTTDWLKIGTSLQLVNMKTNTNSSSSNVIQAALSETPDIPVSNPDGSWGGPYNLNGWVNTPVNPIAIARINTDLTTMNQLYGVAYADISFTKSLLLRNEVSGSFSMANRDTYNPSYTMGATVNLNNSGSYTFSQDLNTTIRNFLTFSHVSVNKYSTNIMVGHEATLSTSELSSASRTNFPTNAIHVVDGGDPSTAQAGGSQGQGAQESYFGRLNFGINEKYLLTGNVRADGSSNFAPGNQWVTTYSGAFAWRINNENFLKNVKFVNDMKLRLGYGLTNNQGIPGYEYTTAISAVASGLAKAPVAMQLQNVGNPKVSWEKTKYSNIGLDGTFFDRRFDFTVDVYDRRTSGLLMQIPLPLYSGQATGGYHPGQLSSPYVNIGDVDNRGIDFRISSTNIKGKDITWRTDLTFSRNINQVKKLNTDGASLSGSYSRTIVGRSIGEFYGYKIDGGVYATKDELLNHPKPVHPDGTPYPTAAAGGGIWYGDLMFKDFNKDGIIDEKDQTFLGSPIPKFQVGLNNTFSYKNFDLNIFFNADYGNSVFNQILVNGENPGSSFGYLKVLNNYAKLVLKDPNGSATDIDNVYVSNPHTDIPGVRNDNTNGNNRTSNKFVEDGSFIRCKNISLGYTIPEKLISKAHVKSLRVYGNVTNVFLITKYRGMDPEIGSWDPLNAGVDSGFYPQPRVYTIGANIVF